MPGASVKIRSLCLLLTVRDRISSWIKISTRETSVRPYGGKRRSSAHGDIALDRNSQRGNQRNAVAGGPLQSSPGRLGQNLSCPPRGGVSSEHCPEGYKQNIDVAPLVVVSPLSTTGRGASGSGSLRKSKIQNIRFQKFNFHIFPNCSKNEKCHATFVRTAIQSWTKV